MMRTPLAFAILTLLLAAGCTPEPQPFTRQEFATFLSDAGHINRSMHVRSRQLAASNNSALVEETIQTEARTAIRQAGWELDRFEYIYGQCAEFAKFERERIVMSRTYKALEKAAKRDMSALKELEEMRKRHAYFLSLRKEILDESVPVSEQIFLHENRVEVMIIVTNPAIPFHP